jgi:hypothetical protein
MVLMWDDMTPFARRALTKAFRTNRLDLGKRPMRLLSFKPLKAELLPVPMTERERRAKLEQAADATAAAKRKLAGGGGSGVREMIRGGGGGCGVAAEASRESLAVSRPGSPNVRQSPDAKAAPESATAPPRQLAPLAEQAKAAAEDAAGSVSMWTPYDVRSWLTESIGVPADVARRAEKAEIDGRTAKTMLGPGWIKLGAQPLKAAEIMGAMKNLPTGSCAIGN